MSQLAQNQQTRLMYIENKENEFDGANARVGWVKFSKTKKTIYYREKSFKSLKGMGVFGNYYDEETGEVYWISGIKKRGDNRHWAKKSITVIIDNDAMEEYNKIKGL